MSARLDAVDDILNSITGEWPDVTDLLSHVVHSAAAVTGSDAAALMVRASASGELSLLAATSHQATQLELLQMQSSNGPCVECITTGRRVQVSSSETISQRWGDVGAAMVERGVQSVAALPVRWRGEALGALNLFRFGVPDGPPDVAGPSWPGDAEIFTHLAALAVMHATDASADQIRSRVQTSLAARDVVEQAKGVLAWQLDLDPASAYDELLRRAQNSPLGLHHVAADIIEQATTPPQN